MRIGNLMIVSLLSLSFIQAKGVKKEFGGEEAHATAKGIMEAHVDWLKDKGSKFDFGLTLTNLTESGVIVYLHDISCKKGATAGEAKHTFFNTGERTIDFKAGQSKKFKLVCKLHTKIDSNKFSVGLRRISSNPSNDGKTVGKLLYKNLNIPITL
ncbi:MAG: hypothetical protein R3A80_04095 [Bdellovibrionota bacterium]